MIFLSFLVILASYLVFVYLTKHKRRHDMLSKLPSRKKRFFLHNSLDLVGMTPRGIFLWMESMHKEFGRVYHYTTGPFDIGKIVVSDPDIFEAILTSNTEIEKTTNYAILRTWLGDGLLGSGGEKWRKRRKLLTSTFHFNILERFLHIMDKQSDIFVKNLEKYENKIVDFTKIGSLFAMDVICETAMGCKINAQLLDSEYVRANHKVTEILIRRFFDPLHRHDWYHKRTKLYQEEKACLKTIHDFTNSVIKNRRAEILKEKSNENGKVPSEKKNLALLDLLLQADIDGVPLSDEDIYEEVATFMFAGHDTSNTLASFALYNIAKNPEVKVKVLDEVNELFNYDKISMSVIQSLPYIDLVLKETLRLFPPGAHFGRCLKEDVVVGKYTFPKGANILMSNYLAGRDPELYPDPMKFDPERFRNPSWKRFQYVPFSAGPRNCIGQRFAMMEMKMLLAKVIKNYDIFVDKEDEELNLMAGFTLRCEEGINLRVVKRRI